jgi:hypothetical protein
MASANLYCSLSGCDCKTQNGQEYCSEYCKQAARHAPERDYCQCGHAGCASQIPFDGTLFEYQLNEAVFLAPGQVTIQCTSAEQLCQDVELLAKALRERSDDLWKRVEPPTTPRRPVASEMQRPLMSAKTA